MRFATKFFLAAALLTGVASTSISAAPQDVLTSFDNIMDKKLVSADGSTILITPSERQFTRQITLPNGTPQKTLFIFFTATNGAVADASDPHKVTGAFQITGQGIEIRYSDGTHEIMAVNSSGGVTREFTSGSSDTCRFWLAEGHVFTEEEREAALAQYAGRFGLASLSTKTGKPGCLPPAPAVGSSPSPQAAAGPDNVITTITTPAQIAPMRAALINNAYGINTGVLPKNMPTVTRGVPDPIGGAEGTVQRVDKYTYTNIPATSTDSYDISAYFYVAPTPNGFNVIINPGHQYTCNWTAFSTSYNMISTISQLLSAGYSVLAENMPGCGDATVHQKIFVNYGDKGMQYFVEPSVETANYWDQHGAPDGVSPGRGYYGITGLSGGGFTTVLTMSLDTRFVVGVDIAGSLPGTQFTCPGNLNIGDGVQPPTTVAEQSAVNFYTIGSFVDQYVLGATGPNRELVQIRNINDDCCFGVNQWNSCLSSLYGMNWYQFIDYYMRRQVGTTVPTAYTVITDPAAVSHQISSQAGSVILGHMGHMAQFGPPPVVASSSR